VRRDADHFAERPMALVYIGKKLKDALRLEEVLTAAGIDYAVEVDLYSGGVIFRSQREGAFFYVEEPDLERAHAAMRGAGFQPHQD
jgi:predicted amino acid racemase